MGFFIQFVKQLHNYEIDVKKKIKNEIFTVIWLKYIFKKTKVYITPKLD